jgi:hypothetical protein
MELLFGTPSLKGLNLIEARHRIYRWQWGRSDLSPASGPASELGLCVAL